MGDGAVGESIALPENVVVNARTKERFEFDRSRSDEAALCFGFVVGPGGGLPMRHVHEGQREVFRCVSGELTVHLSSGDRALTPGDELHIAPGELHAFVNRGSVDAVCEVEYLPAGRNEDWLKIVNAIERVHGREPGLLDLAPFILDVGIFIDGPPRWAQVALFKLLRPIAVAMGRERSALAAAQAVYGRPFTWPRGSLREGV